MTLLNLMDRYEKTTPDASGALLKDHYLAMLDLREEVRLAPADEFGWFKARLSGRMKALVCHWRQSRRKTDLYHEVEGKTDLYHEVEG